jgi:hypothetical protein
MDKFNFFRGIKNNIDWESTGLLNGALNVDLLKYVLNYSSRRILNYGEESIKNNLILPIIVRIFRTKRNSYDNDFITGTVDDIINYINDVDIDIVTLSLNQDDLPLDLEVEICKYVAQKFDWVEAM